VIAGLMIAIAGAPRLRMPMPSEREKLVRDINSLKESISVAWMDMISKLMTAAEREELRRSIDSLVKDLDSLRSKLDRLPKTQV
jgi:predicted  nucleic acid-binding Zn-ribbon protein